MGTTFWARKRRSFKRCVRQNHFPGPKRSPKKRHSISNDRHRFAANGMQKNLKEIEGNQIEALHSTKPIKESSFYDKTQEGKYWKIFNFPTHSSFPLQRNRGGKRRVQEVQFQVYAFKKSKPEKTQKGV